VQTQQSFENLEGRAVAVVVDPIKSTKSGIDMDAFRSIPQNILAGLRMNQG
jgi:26S proteasome regulatory subunit N11